MVELGKYNTLRVVKILDFGVYLDGGSSGEILLPSRYVPESCQEGDSIVVFVCLDSEDRLIATTQRPYAQVGEFSLLRVNAVNRYGAFLDWGLMKDILVPFREQKTSMQPGRSYLVYIYVDHATNRIVASAKIEKFLDNTPPDYSHNQEVDLIVDRQTDLGYRVIINNLHSGIVYHNEIFCRMDKGARMKGYIKQIRPDGKIDVSLQPLGYAYIVSLAPKILDTLTKNGGVLPLSDKSSSEEIASYFSCSKKNFKKAIGALYKERKISIYEDRIELCQ